MDLGEIIINHQSWLLREGGSRADLRDADLRRADLRRADLTGAYLTDADLRDADLRGADLTGAYLRGAYLRGAYLTDAKGITTAQDGCHMMILVHGDVPMIKARCRWFTVEEAKDHWSAKNRGRWTHKTPAYGAAQKSMLKYLVSRIGKNSY